MHLYHFQIQTNLITPAALERVSKLVRDPPGFWQSINEAFDGGLIAAPPFIGRVAGSEFKCQRNIGYRNSFLPRITGRVESCPVGTRIDVKMYLHPATAVFMLIWLGGVAFAAIGFFSRGEVAGKAFFPVAMFIFGVVLTLVGFYPEAIKARRLLEQQLAPTGAQQARATDARL